MHIANVISSRETPNLLASSIQSYFTQSNLILFVQTAYEKQSPEHIACDSSIVFKKLGQYLYKCTSGLLSVVISLYKTYRYLYNKVSLPAQPLLRRRLSTTLRTTLVNTQLLLIPGLTSACQVQSWAMSQVTNSN